MSVVIPDADGRVLSRSRNYYRSLHSYVNAINRSGMEPPAYQIEFDVSVDVFVEAQGLDMEQAYVIVCERHR